MRELPPLDELFDMLDILRENGFEGTYEEMIYKLRHDQASLPFPKSAGPDFAEGGLATLFRHSCVGRNCIIIKSPNHNEIKKNNYKFNNKCYKYI